MIEFMIQNFEIVMFVISMMITAELFLLAYIIFHRKGKKKKTRAFLTEAEHISKEEKPHEKEDQYGFTVMDLDLNDDDFEFHFI